ncbi:MAG: hypothetical protein WD531_01415, partial [Nitrosopumilaceae archaeon]
VEPKIIEENIDVAKYYFDNYEPREFDGPKFSIPSELLTDGSHLLKVVVSDTVGHNVTKEFAFTVDSKAPELVIKSPQNGSTISNTITIDLDVKEQNLPETGGITIILPNGIVSNKISTQFDTRTLENGKYDIQISANDMAGNEISKKIIVNIDNKPFFGGDKESSDQNLVFLQGIIIGIVIATAATIIAIKKIKISKKS